MKILAPLRNSGEVAPLCAAGAHEFYCGLTPPGWDETFGAAWVHRRNPKSAGVPDLDDLRRIVALAGPRPVFATLNAPSYPAGAVPRLVEFGRMLVDDVGVAALIVAEWELLLALCEAGLAPRVHVSSLASCRNPGAAAFYRDLGVARVILPRQVTLVRDRGNGDSRARVGGVPAQRRLRVRGRDLRHHARLRSVLHRRPHRHQVPRPRRSVRVLQVDTEQLRLPDEPRLHARPLRPVRAAAPRAARRSRASRWWAARHRCRESWRRSSWPRSRSSSPVTARLPATSAMRSCRGAAHPSSARMRTFATTRMSGPGAQRHPASKRATTSQARPAFAARRSRAEGVAPLRASPRRQAEGARARIRAEPLRRGRFPVDPAPGQGVRRRRRDPRRLRVDPDDRHCPGRSRDSRSRARHPVGPHPRPPFGRRPGEPARGALRGAASTPRWRRSSRSATAICSRDSAPTFRASRRSSSTVCWAGSRTSSFSSWRR